MTHFIDPQPVSARHAAFTQTIRPFLDRVQSEAVTREQQHILLHPVVEKAIRLGITKLRLPVADGGQGFDLVELFATIIDLGAADPNLANAIRANAGTIEDILNRPDDRWSRLVASEIGAGKLVGSGASEVGGATHRSFETQLVRDGDGYRVTGRKYYTTGALYGDYLNTTALAPDGTPVTLLVPTKAVGVTVLDDWDGFGQQLSASGTAILDNVYIQPEWVRTETARFPHAAGFFQLYHIATLAGIARTIASEATDLVVARTRSYPNRSNTEKSSDDPQVLQVLGRLSSIAYVTRAAALQAAAGLQEASDLASGKTDPDLIQQASGRSELHVSQTVTVVTDLVLEAATILFDTLGASAAKRGLGLDRHWRNARTLASHNPRIFHDRLVGLHAATGELPDWFRALSEPQPAPRKLHAV